MHLCYLAHTHTFIAFSYIAYPLCVTCLVIIHDVILSHECYLFTTTHALHVSLRCGVIRFRLCDRKRPRLHDGVHVLAQWLTT